MRHLLALTLVILLAFSCNSEKKSEASDQEIKVEEGFTSIGKMITSDDALTADRMAVHYAGMSIGDTVPSKMIAKVDEVCQTKGCWMKLSLGDGEQVMVRFKDYGFFMPKDIAGKEVVVNGFAFVDEMSVSDQKHYAEDAGESEEAIAAITKPKKTYSFEADGVLLKN